MSTVITNLSRSTLPEQLIHIHAKNCDEMEKCFKPDLLINMVCTQKKYKKVFFFFLVVLLLYRWALGLFLYRRIIVFEKVLKIGFCFIGSFTILKEIM